jgi:excisionase family DNA binding protein
MTMPTPEARLRAAVAELADALVALAHDSAPSERPAGPVDLWAPAEFARRAGLGRSTLYLAIADGSIRSTKVRGRRLIPSSELTRLAAAAPPPVSKQKAARQSPKAPEAA